MVYTAQEDGRRQDEREENLGAPFDVPGQDMDWPALTGIYSSYRQNNKIIT
jgi:hypothetical protein